MKTRNLLLGILFLSVIPLTAQTEISVDWKNVRSNSEKLIDFTQGNVPEKDSIIRYIKYHKDFEAEYILVPRYIEKPWSQSQQVIPFAKKYDETINNYTEAANMLASIYNNYSKNSKYVPNDPKEKQLVKQIIDNISDSKEQKSILKDFDKGKISSKLLPYIEKYYNYYVKSIKTYKSEYEKLKKQPVSFIATKFNKKVTLDKKIVYDTVPNPFQRDRAYKESYFQKFMTNDLIGDWNWLYNEDGVYVEEQYPVYVSYYKYASHPGLRLTDRNRLAFDDKGNLVGVVIPEFNLYNLLKKGDKRGVLRQIAIWAYEDNKYDIKSQPKKVQDYIKLQLGLRQMTKEEKAKSDKTASAMADATIDYMKADSHYGKNSKQSERAKDKAAEQFLGALLSGSGSYSSEGAAWFRQIEADNRPNFEAFYNLERISDTSFKGTFVDQNLNPICELIFEYTTGKRPYTMVENVRFNRINSTSSSSN